MKSRCPRSDAAPAWGARCSSLHSCAIRHLLAEDALGPEDEDRDQHREDDRAGPVAPRRGPRETLVEGLNQADHDRAEDGAAQVADPAEDGGGECDQAELEAAVVADVELEQEEQASDSG